MINIKFDGIEELEDKVKALSQVKFDSVIKENLTEMHTKTKSLTPVDSAELRESSAVDFNNEIVGYVKDYAPHVEYGHRTRGGGYVKGQGYLQKIVSLQQSTYKQDLLDAIKKG